MRLTRMIGPVLAGYAFSKLADQRLPDAVKPVLIATGAGFLLGGPIGACAGAAAMILRQRSSLFPSSAPSA